MPDFYRYLTGACHGKPVHHAYLTLKIGRPTPFMRFWSHRQVVHCLPIPTQNHQNNYGQALYAVPTHHATHQTPIVGYPLVAKWGVGH